MKLKHLFRNEWKRILLTLLLGILITGINLISTQFTSKLLVNFDNLKSTILIAIILFILAILSSSFSTLKAKITIRCKMAISKKLKLVVAKCFINSTLTSINKYNNNERLASNICNSDELIHNLFAILEQVLGIISGIFVLVYSAFVSIPVFLLFLISFVILLLYQKFSLGILSKKTENTISAHDRTRNIVLEGIEAIMDIKGQLLAPNIKHLFESSLDNESSSSVEETDSIEKNNFFTSFILQIFLLSFLSLGAFLIHINSITTEEFITLFMYKNYIVILTSSISKVVKYYSKCVASTNRINEILKYDSVLEPEKYGTTRLDYKKVTGGLTLENVFLNVDGKQILDNISINIKPNTFVGIVGSGGCGKSTLLKVLSGDIVPTSGDVKLDGFNLKDLDLYSIKSNICHAPQIPFIFSISLSENLRLANKYATEEQMWLALKYAEADGFVKKFKNGLDTIINRALLSGSQLQRLALARIPLHRSKIILLDEATSAMDNLTQSKIISTLKNFTTNHTIIMVAHRINILKDADIILYMENGKIVDRGTYDELYKNNSSFRNLATKG